MNYSSIEYHLIYNEVKLREEVDCDKNLTIISIYKMSYSKQ